MKVCENQSITLWNSELTWFDLVITLFIRQKTSKSAFHKVIHFQTSSFYCFIGSMVRNLLPFASQNTYQILYFIYETRLMTDTFLL